MPDRPTKSVSRDNSPLPSADSPRAARLKAIREARDSIEQDGTIPVEEIEAWVNSWDTPHELPIPQPRKR